MANCKDCIHYDVCKADEHDLPGYLDCNFFKKKSDYQEVKHGEWVENGLYCSVCCYLYDTGEYKNSHNYCPDCGADMRKEKDKGVKPQTLDGGKNE